MHPNSSRFNGASGRPPLPNVASDLRSTSSADAIVMMVKEQEREAYRLRDNGRIGEAIAKFQIVVKLCDDAQRQIKNLAEVFEEKKQAIQQEIEELAMRGGYSAGRRAAAMAPTSPTGPRPSPARSQILPPDMEANANVVVPPSRVTGFRNPVTKLKLDEATWEEYTAFTVRLKNEAEALKSTDVAAAAAKLREAADIWNYAVSSPKFQFFGMLRATAREVADTYMTNANALVNPSGAVPAVNGPASSQVEAVEIDRRVRDCIVRDTPDNKIRWADIIGSREAKDALLSALLDRYIHKGAPEDETRGVLLYGPAGTGKTMLVRGVINLVSETLAKRAKRREKKNDPVSQDSGSDDGKDVRKKKPDESNTAASVSENETQDGTPKDITLFVLKSSAVDSKWFGEGSKFMESLLRIAREEQPAVIFIDEADALFSRRGEGQNEATQKIMTQFMQEIDGLTSSGNITLIAASNQPQNLDDAVLRRLQRSVYVPVPSPEDRAAILEQMIKHVKYPTDLPVEKTRPLALSKAMKDFTGADLKILMDTARSRGPQSEIHNAKAYLEVDDELVPCSEDTPGAMKGSFYDFLDYDFKKLPVRFEHLEAAARQHQPTASKQIPVLEKWKAEIENQKK